MRYACVCSGISAPSAAWQPLGWQPQFFSEIEPFPSAVLAHHYPAVPNYGDMNNFREWPDAAVDVLVAGTPCQAFSVAGLRKGLDDPRGNLTLTFLAVVEMFRPRWITWENVPGVISDKTDALTSFLDGLEALGYIIDIDILDAQFFGLAQRRKRVFVCGQRADDLIQQKTISSALTISQCVVESLLLALGVLSDRSNLDSVICGFDVSEPRRSLQRRMTLFGLHKAEAASMLAENLDVMRRWSECGRGGLASASGKNGTADLRTTGVTRSLRSIAAAEPWRVACLSIGTSWRSILDAALMTMNGCITSTSTNETTESKIYTCAQALLHIAAHITQSMDWSPSFWSAASSCLTALRAYTDYARAASSDLFTELGWLQPWRDLLEQAEPALLAFEHLRVENFGKVLPLAAGLRGDSPPRREAGEGSTHELAPYIGANGRGFERAGDTRGQDAVVPVHAFDARQSGVIQYGNMAGPLDTDGHTQAVTVALRGREGGGTAEIGGDTATALRASQGGGDKPYVLTAVAVQEDNQNGVMLSQTAGSLRADAPGSQPCGTLALTTALRRLTPTECERLMGLPDGYTAIPYRGKPAADGPRYKALGNSMAVPVLAWIGRRIALMDALSIAMQEAAE